MNKLIIPVNSLDHIYGSQTAALELVEYGDYQCPYCGRAYPIVKSIQQKLSAELRFVFRNFPLRKVHSLAFPAAVATEAAALQEKFWEMHDIIFENQAMLKEDIFYRFAKEIGIDPEQFNYNVQKKELIEKVEYDFETGLRSGVNRTPTFFINGIKYDGSLEENYLLQYLENQLTGISISR